MQLHPVDIWKLLGAAKRQSLSLRRRLVVYLIAQCCAVALLVFCVLNLLGMINPFDRQMEDALVQQLDITTARIVHDTDDAAAWGYSLSQKVSEAMDGVLQARRLSFEDMRKNEEALNEIQTSVYGDVYSHMQLATCSGAFYLLNTTVNDSLPDKSYNGLYLKYANLYAENTIRNKACMFRGSYAVARANGIGLYSAWRLEMLAETFPQAIALMDGQEKYLMTEVCSLPDSWERVRLLCVPIRLNGEVIGVCGFEVSDLYFQLVYPVDSGEEERLLCALLTEKDGLWTGQISGRRSANSAPVETAFSRGQRGRFEVFSSENGRYVGLMREIDIEDSRRAVAAMLPLPYYEHTLHRSGLKADETAWQPSDIPEIDDLFAYLALKNRMHEEEINRLQMQNADVQRGRERVESALSNLHAAGMQEIDPEAYEMFCTYLDSLTP